MDGISHKINVRNKYIVLVDGDVASDVVDSYMTWIACMLREIELMTLSGVHLYRLYREVILPYLVCVCACNN